MHWQPFACRILKAIAWAYFLATSLYCLLAYLPYTWHALINAPPLPMLPWFARWHAALFWIAVAGVGADMALSRAPRGAQAKIAVLVLASAGIALALHPILPGIRSTPAAYAFALLALYLPLTCVRWRALYALAREDAAEPPPLPWHAALLLGVAVAVLNVLVCTHDDPARTRLAFIECSVAAHGLVAVLAACAFNFATILSRRFRHPAFTRCVFLVIVTLAALWILLDSTLRATLDFYGTAVLVYSGSLAFALTAIACELLLRPQARPTRTHVTPIFPRIGWALAMLAAAGMMAALPTAMRDNDWNGIFRGTLTLAAWGVLGYGMSRWLPRLSSTTLRSTAATATGAISIGALLTFTAFAWAWPLGDSNRDVDKSLGAYAARDTSFGLAYRLLGHSAGETCNAFCRTLIENTEIPDAKARFDLDLTGAPLQKAENPPNIFIFVIDSLRRDYVGAYDSKATFTPSIDAFARESTVVQNAYTQYAGTSLSEPSIWAGSLLLHSHYQQPFSRLNSLEKMLRLNNYEMLVSKDEVLLDILSPDDRLTILDQDKKEWARLDICSTVDQLKTTLPPMLDGSRPIFFYSQPKNVHQFGRNSLPSADDVGWNPPEGFDRKTAFHVSQTDACFGDFVQWMKARGIFDDSIIVLTSDHGNATGELGRFSHSVVIYPEIMRVPIIFHVPDRLKSRYSYSVDSISSLTDITPSIYSLLGYPLLQGNPLFGKSFFHPKGSAPSEPPRKELFMASDAHPIYGILGEGGRSFYVTYANPTHSYLYDLGSDPLGTRDVLTGAKKLAYDNRVLWYLGEIHDFYIAPNIH